MGSGNFKTKMLAGATAGLIFLSGVLSSCVLNVRKENTDSNNVKPTQKGYENVLNDLESFNADSEILYNLIDNRNALKFIRLSMSEEKPVIVECDEILKDNERAIVQKTIDYYNKVFSTINENYKFVIKEENTVINDDDTVIRVGGDTGAKGTVGVTNDWQYTLKGYEGDVLYITRASINLDWKDLSENEMIAYCVLLHEFGHVLGFGDTYYYGELKVSDTVNQLTYMNGDLEIIDVLYPNDYALLQALYSKEFERHDNYEDAVRVVNEKIEKYTSKFFKYYAQRLKSEFNATDKMKELDFTQEICCPGFVTNMYIKLIDNTKCEVTIKDVNGNILEKCESDILFVDGVLFIRGVQFNELKNYRSGSDPDLSFKTMFSIYINESGRLTIHDGNYESQNIKLVKTETMNR